LQIGADIPAGTKLEVSTRSGNTAKPERGGWQDWSRPVEANEYVKVSSAPGRFLQYRLEMITDNDKLTPKVHKVRIAYITPNLPPQIGLLKVAAQPAKPGSQRGRFSITWKAADANHDRLQYDVYARLIGSTKWVQIAKNIMSNKYEWNGLSVADGR